MNSLALFIFAAVAIGASTSLRSVCYHTNWSQYRSGGGKFFPDDIDPSLCTHLIYAFAKLDGQNHLKAFEWNDESESWSKGLYEKFNDLKQKSPSLKTLIAVGGWNMGSGPFTKMAATSATRLDFAKDAVKFLRDRHFDGLDIDWEYPAGRGSPPGDRAKYTDLIMKLRETFDDDARTSGKEALLLSVAVPAGKPHIDNGFDIPAVTKSVDLINLMSYDLHGSWETFTGHNSPLYARSDETGDQRYLNLDWAANYWVQKGAPKHKMNIGMGLYGRSFTLASASNSAPGAPTKGPGLKGLMTKEAGFISYYEICKIQQSGGVVHRIQEQMVPYIVQGDQWIGYDDAQSLTTKVNYVKQHGYGGVMVWALPLDDFKGTSCGLGPYPLMHAIHAALGGTSQPIVAPLHTNHPMITAPTKHPVNSHTTQAANMQTNSFSCINKGTGFYENPASCSSYYVCVSGASYPIHCRAGLYYNPQTQVCDFESNVQCHGDDHHHAAATSAPEVHTTAAAHTDPLNFCATKTDGLHGDPATCKMYYNCAQHVTYHQPCAPGTGFDDSRKICDIPSHLNGCH